VIALRGDYNYNYNMESKGLGDTIEKITTATGVKKFVHTITGGGCGCEKRKQILNKVFPYKKSK
tara:strand:- start:738 stop:929 length:192 start_codon:yes stop_codon:yes gene_type:complete